MTKKILILASILVVALAVVFSLNQNNKKEEATETSDNVSIQQPAATEQKEQSIITYTKSGFSPDSLEVKVGTKVTFKNLSSGLMWVASHDHPSHKIYPNSDIKKCNSAEANAIFDQCKTAKSGEEWSFTFNETGTWEYHNHVESGHSGEIIVK